MGFLSRSKTTKGSSSPELPSYDSICPPNDSKQPMPVSTDAKQPLTSLANLRKNITANRAAQIDEDALFRRSFLDGMVQATHEFLSDYSLSTHLRACLTFVPPPKHLEDSSKFYQNSTDSEEFTRKKLINTTVFWESPDAAGAMAIDLKARLEEELGDFHKLKRKSNVALTVVARSQKWICKELSLPANEFITTGWVLVVEVRIIDAKKRSR